MKYLLQKINWVQWLATVAVMLFALLLFSDNRADVDLWGNVGFVTALPGSPDFHKLNTFSYTEPNHPWINHEWGAEYIFNRTFTYFGSPGLIILKVMLGFALLAVIYSAMRRDCHTPAARFFIMLLIISTIGYGFSTRPHLFTYLLTALLLAALTRRPIHPAVALAAAPLGCLWANLHGAFFTGELLLLIFFVISLTRRLFHFSDDNRDIMITATAALLFFGGTLLNPYGIHLWGFVLDSAALTRPVLSEWAPFNPLKDFSNHIDFIVLALFTIPAVLITARKSGLATIVTLALTLAAAFAMRRNIPLFAIVAGLTAGRAIDTAYGRRLDDFVAKLPRTLLMVLLAVACGIPAFSLITRNIRQPLAISVAPDKFPTRAMAFLQKHHIHGNAIVFFDWAEYAIWHLYPDCRVFMDGRFRSAYSTKTISDYIDFIYADKNFSNALEKYPTNIVFSHIGNPCTALMTQRPGWTLIYHDNIAAIFVKNTCHHDLLNNLQQPTHTQLGSSPRVFP